MVRLTDRPDMTLDVYRGRKTTMQQQQQQIFHKHVFLNKNKHRYLDSSQNKRRAFAVLASLIRRHFFRKEYWHICFIFLKITVIRERGGGANAAK